MVVMEPEAHHRMAWYDASAAAGLHHGQPHPEDMENYLKGSSAAQAAAMQSAYSQAAMQSAYGGMPHARMAADSQMMSHFYSPLHSMWGSTFQHSKYPVDTKYPLDTKYPIADSKYHEADQKYPPYSPPHGAQHDPKKWSSSKSALPHPRKRTLPSATTPTLTT